jgi:predicted nucleic acid-binding protein
MNAIDTNVLIYSIDRHDPIKRAKARALLRSLQSGPQQTILPWQVLGELVRFLRAWQDRGQITRPALMRYVHLFRNVFPLSMPTPSVLDRALDLSDRFSLSHWDSMLIGACIEAGVDTLYTEDMGAPTQFDGIRLVNPFI